MNKLQELVFMLCLQIRMDLVDNKDAVRVAHLNNVLWSLKKAYPREYAVANPSALDI